MTSEQIDAALVTEADRLAERWNGEPDYVRDGLRSFVRDRAVDVAADELELLAARAGIRHRATKYCKVGYRSHDYWLDTLQREVAEMTPPVPDAEEVGEIFLNAWRARVAEQRDWPEQTDNDRLSRAFTTMNRNGIVAREHFACCQQCAGSEIFDEIPHDSEPAGFVFFHEQDTMGAVARGKLLLGFGGFEPRPNAPANRPRVRHAPEHHASHVAVAEGAVAALRDEGLTVHWNGSQRQRITVEMDWKRRIAPR